MQSPTGPRCASAGGCQCDSMHYTAAWHAGLGSELHTDPVQTSAWNALVFFYLKEWVVIEPHVHTHPSRRFQGCSPSRAPTRDAATDLSSTDLGEMRVVDDVAPVHRWISKYVPRLWAHARCVASSGICSSSSSSSSSSSRVPRMMRFTQRPGDIVYLPCGWQHAVLNRCWRVAITHNFVAPELR